MGRISVDFTLRQIEFLRVVMQDMADVSDSAGVRRDATNVLKRLDAAVRRSAAEARPEGGSETGG